MIILVLLLTIGSNFAARDAMFRKCLPLRVNTNYLTSRLVLSVLIFKLVTTHSTRVTNNTWSRDAMFHKCLPSRINHQLPYFGALYYCNYLAI